MNRKCFARCFRSVLARFFLAASLLTLACPAVYAQYQFSTSTTLVLSSPTSVTAGTVETLTASVTFPALLGGTGPGLVTFFDGKTVLGTGQLITISNSPVGPAGSAVLKTRLGIGAHSLSAAYSGESITVGSSVFHFQNSASAAQPLNVTGNLPFSLSLSGVTTTTPGLYAFTATASVSGRPTAPSGQITFNDASDATLQLGTGSLAAPILQTGFTQAYLAPASYDRITIAVGDFNGDGIPDIATASYLSFSVSILLGQSDGTYLAKPNAATGVVPYAIAAGDFNGDGILDLATANAGSGTVTVLLGNGDGTFNQGTALSTDLYPTAIALGDFNGDGYLDIATTNFKGNDVTVLLGDGGGGFTPAPGSPAGVGQHPFSLAIGDLNGDGIADMVVTNQGDGSVTVLLGNGDGSFKAAAGSPFQTGIEPSSVVIGDFNGDGRPDLAIANGGGASGLSVLLQQADGSFAASGTYPNVPNTLQVVTGDFNGDGIADLAMASDQQSDYNPGYIFILQGDGKGGFQTSPTSILMAVGAESSGLVVADLNGDGVADLASCGVAGVELLDGFLTSTATASLTAVVPGSGAPHSVVAEYLGSANLPSAISNAVPVGAALEKTSLALTAPAYAQPGQPFTLSALLSRSFVRISGDDVLSTDGRSITFLSGTTTLGSAVINGGVATLNVSLPAGTAKLTAVFAGDYNFAGSTSAPVTVVVGSPTQAALSLKGQYAFLIHASLPYAANTPVNQALAGSFTADGAGHISAGVEDINTGNGTALGLTLTGTYSVAADGSGTATITNSLGQSLSFAFTISGMASNGTAAAANVILLGGTLNGSGVLLQQNPAEFGLANLQDGYAFALTGESCYSACSTPTTNTGAVSANWRALLGGSTALTATANEQVGSTPYQGLALGGTVAAPSPTTGRMTLTMNAITTPANQPADYVVYVVDSAHLLLLSTDPHSTTMLLSGEGVYQ